LESAAVFKAETVQSKLGEKFADEKSLKKHVFKLWRQQSSPDSGGEAGD